ncbi:MAG: hypothetical protein ACRDHD_01330 [Candidatus Limnocylindria bacterium]
MPAVSQVPPRNRASVGARLRHEALALRLVAVTMQAALDELDQLHASAEGDRWADQLAGWVDGVLEYHRGRIGLLRGLAGDDPNLARVDHALADAEAAARQAHARRRPSSAVKPGAD